MATPIVYLCLKLNYPNEKKEHLLTLASLTFLFPSLTHGVHILKLPFSKNVYNCIVKRNTFFAFFVRHQLPAL